MSPRRKQTPIIPIPTRGADEVNVDYSQVASQTAALNSYIQAQIVNIQDQYCRIKNEDFCPMDSSTNATLIDVAKLNEQKSIKIALVFDKLTNFIAGAAKQTERMEAGVTSKFRAPGVG